MKVSVKVFTGGVSDREVELPDGSTYFDLLSFLKVNPETVVVFRDGTPVAFDSAIEGSRIEVLRVVSGG
ncbi:Sulfur transfer protein involved in thiamine biosynthesis [Methanocella conradii HZ254]|uniref:Sulfur transfer protein involved in thiamine biosynthesis n=1 Tax=Methanocella conradii (strain DSM 24694 / JCM 17849 / CGMCC 1.5162 / HZ254) TaxID=1041930 RepID=H8I9X6_METCZ|nr:MoaD/ThiS family protein [Methanocella conradii]AFD00936.1 Sulfur transfer protein involved in thiamine biosynthesis [Methanocella conradii HZ254]MDI6897610.1 MoaD/ThiS family protein [Methanocella conradii]